MLDSRTYYITKNNLGRNILVINELLNVDGTEEIKGEDFDIIFVDIDDFSFNEISLFLQKSSPVKPVKKHLSYLRRI